MSIQQFYVFGIVVEQPPTLAEHVDETLLLGIPDEHLDDQRDGMVRGNMQRVRAGALDSLAAYDVDRCV